MTGDILASIDGALHDWETSDDAMRWVPKHERTEEKRPDDEPGRMRGARCVYVVLDEVRDLHAPTLEELNLGTPLSLVLTTAEEHA